MTQLAALSKVTWCTTLALLLAAACGGNSFSGGDPPNGGTGATGNVGGSTSEAGKGNANTGGKTTGGSGHGGSGATAGTSSGGSSNGDACSAPPESGACDAYVPSWYHDVSTGLCRPFVYGGCGGNDNRYDSFEACQTACPGGSPNYDACKVATDCVVSGAGCCGVCDNPQVTARDLIAYNKQYAGQVQQCGLAGGAPGAAAPDVPACAPCPPVMGDSGTLKYFVPNCVNQQCVVEDIRTSPVTACKSEQDCRLRNGSGCCENCGLPQTIAVRTDGSFEQLVCGDVQPPCNACVQEPVGAIAFCGAAGHCEVEYFVSDGGAGTP